MSKKLVYFQRGFRKEGFEEVSVAYSLEDLKNQLEALDLSLLKDNPVLVLLGSKDSFHIYSKGVDL